MKAKELIKILDAVDPDSELTLGIGRYGDNQYREQCAKAELHLGECLNYLIIDCVVVNKDDDDGTVWADIILCQNNISDLSEVADDYDKVHRNE